MGGGPLLPEDPDLNDPIVPTLRSSQPTLRSQQRPSTESPTVNRSGVLQVPRAKSFFFSILILFTKILGGSVPSPHGPRKTQFRARTAWSFYETWSLRGSAPHSGLRSGGYLTGPCARHVGPLLRRRGQDPAAVRATSRVTTLEREQTMALALPRTLANQAWRQTSSLREPYCEDLDRTIVGPGLLCVCVLFPRWPSSKFNSQAGHIDVAESVTRPSAV